MDYSSRLRSFGPIPYRPLPHFVGSGGKEAPQVHHRPHSRDNLW